MSTHSISRHGEYFRAELAVDNAAAPVWLSVTNLGLLLQGTNVLAAATTGHLLIPPSTQTFTHDLDGNQTSDGVWTNTWSAENRMMTTETLSTVPAPARRREVWSHLPDGRWSQRIVSTNNGTSYFPAFTNRYVWDGQVLLAVLDHTNGVVMTFLRGLDLSGSMQGAGGVGGVLAVSFATNGTHFDAYDGNGNVAGLVAASNATVTATYEYAAFGEVLRASGPAAALNPIQFSTQYADEVRGTVKYLFRDYEARDGRWLSRDPIGEKGGKNLNGFLNNAPITKVDKFGLTLLMYQNISPVTQGGGLEYSCNCGWMDGSHIEEGRKIIRQLVNQARDAFTRGDPSVMFESSTARLYHRETFNIDIGLMGMIGVPDVAMGIFMDYTYGYEYAQNNPFLPFALDSSFSVEDLPSWYLGALIGINEKYPGAGKSWADIKSICQPVGISTSQYMFKQADYMPNHNYSHKPIQAHFNKTACDSCTRLRTPAFAQEAASMFSRYTSGIGYTSGDVTDAFGLSWYIMRARGETPAW